jgi:FkbM family methyltransferase
MERHGWYLRKTAGLSSGVDCFLEIRERLVMDLHVVFDVGAHRGETVFEVIKRFPAAQIYAFEPVRSNFEALQSRCFGLPNVACYPLALGDRDGDTDIFLHEHSQTHTLRQPVPNGTDHPTTTIKIATLDRFLKNSRVHSIDLLKIDVEGYELNVLDGASRTLEENPPRLILAEASLDPGDRIHSSFSDIIVRLHHYGYRVLSIYDQVVWLNPKRLAYFNALFGRE